MTSLLLPRWLAALTLLVGLPLTALAQDAPATEPADSRVTVEIVDFSTMRETKHLRGIPRRDTEQSVRSLARWLEKRVAKQLPAEQQITVTFNDVDLAGDYEPGSRITMQDVRIVKDIYPPRIQLSWRITDASGALVQENSADLRDPAFMTGGTPIATDPLRYEKRLLTQWLRTLFPQS